MRIRSNLIAVCGIAALAACGSTSTGPREPLHVAPAVVTHFHDVPGAAVLRGCLTSGRRYTSPIRCAAWAGPHILDVLTLGSGTCPSIPTSVVAYPPNLIVVKIVISDLYPPRTICTADISPTTSVLHVPASIDSSRPVQVQNDGATIQVLPLGSAVVPDVSSGCLTVQQAAARLRAAEFIAQGMPASPVDNQCMPRGGVVAQDPRAGQRVPIGTVVYLSNV